MTGRPSQAAIEEAGRILAAADRAAAGLTPRQQAEAAWTPTCRFNVDELEDQIRESRGLPLKHTA